MLRQLQVIDKIIFVLLAIGKIKIKTGTLVTVLEDFSNLSGIWNG